MTPKGLTERRVIRSINYEGIHTVTVSEILDRFKERKVGLVVESQYDPAKIQHASTVLKEFLAERGFDQAWVLAQPEKHGLRAARPHDALHDDGAFGGFAEREERAVVIPRRGQGLRRRVESLERSARSRTSIPSAPSISW